MTDSSAQPKSERDLAIELNQSMCAWAYRHWELDAPQVNIAPAAVTREDDTDWPLFCQIPEVLT